MRKDETMSDGCVICGKTKHETYVFCYDHWVGYRQSGLDILKYVAEQVRAHDAAKAEQAKAEPAPVCGHCNDSHMMHIRDRYVPCTHCPSPCEKCRQHLGAHCQRTPCDCECHKAKTEPATNAVRLDEGMRPEPAQDGMSQEEREAWELNERLHRDGLDPIPWSEYVPSAKEQCMEARAKAAEIFGRREAERPKPTEAQWSCACSPDVFRAWNIIKCSKCGAAGPMLIPGPVVERAETAEARVRELESKLNESGAANLELRTNNETLRNQCQRLGAELREASAAKDVLRLEREKNLELRNQLEALRNPPTPEPRPAEDPDELARLIREIDCGLTEGESAREWETSEVYERSVQRDRAARLRAFVERTAREVVKAEMAGKWKILGVDWAEGVKPAQPEQPRAPKVGDWVVLKFLGDNKVHRIATVFYGRGVMEISTDEAYVARVMDGVTNDIWRYATPAEVEAGKVLPDESGKGAE